VPSGIACALACVLFAATAAGGEVPQGAGRPRTVATDAGVTLQARRLAKGKGDFERLSGDARRNKRRDTWELVIAKLESAFSVAPKGPRAVEAAALGARAREELWSASRRKPDAIAAIEAYRRVDEAFPGTPEAEGALSRAVNLARRIGEADAAASIARRLVARYPGTGEAESAAVLAGFGARSGAAGIPDAIGDEKTDEAELPPEPEAPEPVGGIVVKQAVPPPAESDLDRPEKVEKARELRSVALTSKAGSLPEQLGLRIRRVVVDPGHGGRDTGALGPRGTREKDVALAIAKALAVKLRALGFAVVLTRQDDRTLTLDERTRIANDAHADLFLSIHCNAARRRKLSGIETWTLNVASNRYAARLAAFENTDADRSASDLRLILADLATRANADDSRDIAQSVQSALIRALRLRGEKVTDHGIKHALFYVLLGARMPAILAEENRLRSRDRQRAAAEAIAAGVREFADARRRFARFP